MITDIIITVNYTDNIKRFESDSNYYILYQYTTCAFPSVNTPIAFLTVVCTFGETANSFVPRSWFRSVDLPTFGVPITAAFSSRCSSRGGAWAWGA